MGDKLERLQKVIAQSGLTSRRKAEQFIIDGRVEVNHKVVTELGTKVSQSDEVAVDGVPIDKEQFVYYVLNKPREYISTVSDDKGRKTVIDLMENVPERVFPIGRLDYQSSGILLLTNDGDFANQLMHPSYGIKKSYIVKVKGLVKKEQLELFKTGIKDNGETLKAVDVKALSNDNKKHTTIVSITLITGKNRQVRRMFDAINHPVMKLKRESYGPLKLDNLQPGEYRALSKHEIQMMQNKIK